MPAKQRPGKGKQHHSKKSKTRQRMASTPAAPPVAEIAAPAPAEVAPAPTTAAAPAPKPAPARQKAATMQYPYFGGEMRRIAVLAVILLVVLFVLARVLS